MWICPKCGRTFKRNHQSHYCGNAPLTVDEYIQAQPEEIRPVLIEMREILRQALPDVKEKIAWGMPTYWDGCNLIHFAASKKHIALYPGENAVQFFARELEDYSVQKGTIRLPYEKPLPSALIEAIARWCYQTSQKEK